MIDDRWYRNMDKCSTDSIKNLLRQFQRGQTNSQAMVVKRDHQQNRRKLVKYPNNCTLQKWTQRWYGVLVWHHFTIGWQSISMEHSQSKIWKQFLSNTQQSQKWLPEYHSLDNRIIKMSRYISTDVASFGSPEEQSFYCKSGIYSG